MKRNIILIYTLLMLSFANNALADNEFKELGHHWSLPTYTHEIHIQVAAMAVIAGVILISPIVVGRFKNRGVRQ